MERIQLLFYIILILVITVTNVSSQSKYNDLIDKRDGKKYKTVRIGSQIWMAENLAYHIKDSSWALNMEKANEKMYGLLYTWTAAQSACPTGWHLPARQEWQHRYNGAPLLALKKL